MSRRLWYGMILVALVLATGAFGSARAAPPVTFPDSAAHTAVSVAASRCGYEVYIPLVVRDGGTGGGAPRTGALSVDFNNDGSADLAVSAVYADVSGKTDVGAVNVVYGNNSGLIENGSQFWTQNPLNATVETDDQFGRSLAAGDFDGDGCTDLAIGTPYEDVAGSTDGGAVNVIYGSVAGLNNTDNQLWTQKSLDNAVVEANDQFGGSLAAGDYNGDGRDDLAVGVALEDISGKTDAGAVNIIYGSDAGLNSAGNQLWTQRDVTGALEADDWFGSPLTAGDYNGDGRDDLAVGVLGEDVSGSTYAGAVNIIYGSAAGLDSAGNQLWTQQDVTGTVEADDQFGWSLTAGDYDGDGRDDLAVGVALEDISGKTDAGAVNVIYGGAAGLVSAGNQLWTQRDVTGTVEANDGFGDALTAGDYDGDGRDDLAVGVPYENVAGSSNAGAVNVIYGSSAGLDSSGNQLWTQQDVTGTVERGDWFGATLR